MSDQPKALRMADELDGLCSQYDSEIAAELRRLHSELERKSDAIQRLWKERDELRSENRTLVRQNGEWQALNAELVEALREIEPILARMYGAQYRLYLQPMQIVRGALAKVEASNEPR